MSNNDLFRAEELSPSRCWRQPMYWIRCVAAVFIAVMMTWMASPQAYADNPDDEVGVLRDQPLAHQNTLWPGGEIPVCWEAEGAPAEFATERQWVEEAVESSWDAVSNVNFTGWAQCPAGEFDGVRILVAETWPRVEAFGVDLKGLEDGIKLAFDFSGALAADFPHCIDTADNPRAREFCIRAIAVHEFGHVLGFRHEHERTDTPTACTADGARTGVPTVVTAYDQNSIMNYCALNWNNNGTLSLGDVRGVQSLYGPFTSESPLVIDYTGSISITDDEVLENETGRQEISGQISIHDTITSDFNRHSFCVGDEVRVDANVAAALISGSSSVRASASATMYEGTSCDTMDDEADESDSLTLDPNAPSGTIELNLFNSAPAHPRGYSDTAVVIVEFSRSLGESLAEGGGTPGCPGCTGPAENSRFADSSIVPEQPGPIGGFGTTGLSLDKTCKPEGDPGRYSCRLTVTNDAGGVLAGEISLTDVTADPASGAIIKAAHVEPEPESGWDCGSDTSENVTCTIDREKVGSGQSRFVDVIVELGEGTQSFRNCVEGSTFTKDRKVTFGKVCVDGGSQPDDTATVDFDKLTVVKTGPAKCKAGETCAFEIKIANTQDQPVMGSVAIVDGMTDGNGQVFDGVDVVSITPPLGCAGEPTQLFFGCRATVSFAAGESKVHKVVVKMPEDAADKSDGKLTNCVMINEPDVLDADVKEIVQNLPNAAPDTAVAKRSACHSIAVEKQEDEVVVGCTLGMELTSDGRCVCPVGTRWNGRRCHGTESPDKLSCWTGWTQVAKKQAINSRQKGLVVKARHGDGQIVWCAREGVSVDTGPTGPGDPPPTSPPPCYGGKLTKQYEFGWLCTCKKDWTRKPIGNKGGARCYPPTCAQKGMIGKWPNCKHDVQCGKYKRKVNGECRPIPCGKGYTGYQPNCKPLRERCPSGWIGKYKPNCKKPTCAMKGMIGKWPNCKKPVVCGKYERKVGNSCLPIPCGKGYTGFKPNCKPKVQCIKCWHGRVCSQKKPKCRPKPTCAQQGKIGKWPNCRNRLVTCKNGDKVSHRKYCNDYRCPNGTWARSRKHCPSRPTPPSGGGCPPGHYKGQNGRCVELI